ncbi:MAG: (Fe-S)-binding protein [Candidatus Thorarchaeota archaeon]|nr:(Fe-S)-binding protein [Candidatus Thorarchaeota archaeon]
MSSIWTRSAKASPQFDCGLCGYPKCASFTRAVLVDSATLDQCPLLKLNEFAGLLSELESLLLRKTGLRFRTVTELPEGGVLLTRPCKDTDQKVMAELRVHNGVPVGEIIRFGVFDSALLCDYSECLSDTFEVVKCSRDLGYGRADTGELSITLLQDGRINMRRVDNKESVLAAFAIIEAAILGSTICNCCGNDLISILSGLVSHQDAHTVLKAGSSICVDRDIVAEPLSREIFMNEFNESEIASEIDNGFKLLEESIQSLIDGIALDLTFVEKLVSADCRMIALVRNHNNEVRETILLKTLGTLWVLRSAYEAITMIEQLMRPQSEEQGIESGKMLTQILAGIEVVPPPLTDEPLFQIYAHSLRFLRCFRKKTEWFGL